MNLGTKRNSSWLIYFSFVVIGLASLLPWNAFITASEYFRERFCGTYFEKNFECYFSISFFAFQILGLFTQLHIEHSFGYKHKLLLPLLISFGIFMFLIFSVYLPLSGEIYFALCLVLSSCFGFCSDFVTGGLYEFTAKFGAAKQSQGAMVGQALSGVIVSAFSFVSFLSERAHSFESAPDDCHLSGNEALYLDTMRFFSFSAFLLLLASLLCYFHVDSGSSPRVLSQYDTIPSDTGDASSNKEYLSESTYPKIESLQVEPTISPTTSGLRSVYLLGRRLGSYCIPLLLIYGVTLSIFPALTTRVTLCSGKHSALFVASLFLMYNIMDVFGRFLAGFSLQYTAGTIPTIYAICFTRIVLVPLMLILCFALHPSLHPTVCFNMTPVIIISLLGVSNGYAASLCMMHWSREVEVSERDMGSTLVILSLTLGLATGSIVSFGVVHASLVL